MELVTRIRLVIGIWMTIVDAKSNLYWSNIIGD
jgi:hypothetical protein